VQGNNDRIFWHEGFIIRFDAVKTRVDALL
jgi:hypothetical protein